MMPRWLMSADSPVERVHELRSQLSTGHSFSASRITLSSTLQQANYGLCFGVFAFRVEISCSAASGIATVPESAISLAGIFRP